MAEENDFHSPDGQVQRPLEFTLLMARIIKDSLLFLIIGITLYWLLAILGYNAKDPAWSHIGLQPNVSNWTGVIGALWADIAFSFVGLTAWCIPFMVLYPSIRLYLRKSISLLDSLPFVMLRVTGALVCIFALSALSSLHISNINLEYPFTAGGIVGQAFSDWLVSWFSILGSSVILWFGLFIGLTAFLETSWRAVIIGIGGVIMLALDAIVNGFARFKRSDTTDEYSGYEENAAGVEDEPFAAPYESRDNTAETLSVVDRGKDSNIHRYEVNTLNPDETNVADNVAEAKSVGATDVSTTPLDQGFSSDHEVIAEHEEDQPEEKPSWLSKVKQRFKKQTVDSIEQPNVEPTSDKIEPSFSSETVDVSSSLSAAALSASTLSASTSANTLNLDTDTSVAKVEAEQPITAETAVSSVSVISPRKTAETVLPAVLDTPIVTNNDVDLTPPPQVAGASVDVDVGAETASAKKSVKIVPLSETHQSTLDNDTSLTGTVTDVRAVEKVKLPPVTILDPPEPPKELGYSAQQLEDMSRLLEVKLKDFGVVVEVVEVNPGPVITRFEIQPAPGVKSSKIVNLAKDLARSLAVMSVRVVEVIPGKSVMGIEIPNINRQMVRLSEVLGASVYQDAPSYLTLALGNDIAGNPVVANLAKMPHLLVAGTTGSGKSVGVNAMLLSLLFKATPQEVRLMLVDPKMLELSIYEGIPHLLTPVITDMKEAAGGLRWCVAEMERRYKLMSKMGVRNLDGFNKKVCDAIDQGEPFRDPVWSPEENGEPFGTPAPFLETLPYIVVVIDEFADMMMIVGKKVEELIARIAQKARAAGIHLILATQRPSVDVITGLIKANVPTRIAFQVSSKIDSRTILDQGGAENLLGNGDMLFLPAGTSVPSRVHGAFVSDDEVHRTVESWKKQGRPEFIDLQVVEEGDKNSNGTLFEDDEQDVLYDEAVAFVTSTRKASISSVQRKLKIGYNRAARMIETMEAAGVITTAGSNGQREVLAPPPPPRN